MSKHILRKHVSGFTIVSNNVIKVLKGDLETLGFYLYLLSLPNDWTFYKTKLCKNCHIGLKKLDVILKKLSALGLVHSGQYRGAHGRFSHFYLDVYDTETLKPLYGSEENEHVAEEVVEIETTVHDAQPERQNCRTVRTVGRSGEAIKETLTKEELKTKSLKILSASEDAQISFNLFWEINPHKKNKKRAFELWIKKGCHVKADYIIEKLSLLLAHDDQWKNPRYVPHPSTIINGERWEDEISVHKATEKEHPVTSAIRDLKDDMRKSNDFTSLLN